MSVETLEEDRAMKKLLTMAVLGWVLALASGCVPLAVGAGAVVVTDEIIEDDRGGDGLF